MAVDVTRDAVFYAKFTTPKVVLDRTGPLTLTFQVNGAKVGAGTYDADRAWEFRAPLRPEWLARQPVEFGFDVDKSYVAEDGVKLTVLLEAIGFERAGR